MINPDYLLPSSLLALFVLLILISLIIKYKKSLTKQKSIISEQKEKIKWLRQVFSENEHRFAQKEHDFEKRIVQLKSTIESLEEKAKSGTKNQVVAKLEALQSKRERLLQRANIHLDQR